MGNHREICNRNLTEACSKEVHELMKIDYAKTEECVKNSFTDPNDFAKSTDNTYFSEDMMAR